MSTVQMQILSLETLSLVCRLTWMVGGGTFGACVLELSPHFRGSLEDTPGC